MSLTGVYANYRSMSEMAIYRQLLAICSSRSNFPSNNAVNECTKRRSDFRSDADAISDQHFLMVNLHERRVTPLAFLHCKAHRVIAATSLSPKLEETVPEQFIGKPI